MRFAALLVVLVFSSPAIGQAPQDSAPAPANDDARSAADRLAEADALIAKGRALRLGGNSDAAEAPLKRALELRLGVLGPDDPTVAQAYVELGSVYYNRAQYDLAEQHYRQALESAEKSAGPRSLEVANILDNLGFALREERKYADAEKTVLRSLSIRTLLLPKDDPAIAASLDNLGRTYLRQGRYAQAQIAVTESARIYQKAYGDDDARLRQTRELLALIERGRAAPPPTEITGKGAPGSLPLKLNSGASVAISAMGPLTTPEGWAGYVLLYDTTIPLDDTSALRREVDEIWEHFVVDVANSGYERAIIAANAPAADAAAPRRSAHFLFTAQADGWRADEGPVRAKIGLDPEFVRSFIDRFDWLIEHYDANAAALYLSGDWTATAKVAGQGDEKTYVLDRNQFIASVRAASQLTRTYQHHRDILDIAIDPDARTATVESRETENSEMDGKKMTTVGKSVDVLTLVDGHAQLTRSYEDATVSGDAPL
jgi:tetratricopeptide (TPR) repeat protein